MADRYWVTGGNGVWTDTSNWSATSGGSSGASAPTNSDNAFFDRSATYTVTGNATALNLLVSAGTVTFNLGINGFGGTGATYFTFNSGTVAAFTATSTTTFSTTSGSTLTITTNGVALTGTGGTTFGTNLRTGIVAIGSDFAITGPITAAKITLAYGTLSLNSYKLTCEGAFTTANAVNHTIDFGTGNITITGANVGNVAWDTSAGTNAVAGTPTVNISYNVGGTLAVATQAAGSEANSISFNFTTGTYTLTFLNTTGYVARSVSFAGFGGTWAARTTNNTIYGDLTLSAVAGFSMAASTGTLTLGSTSATTRILTGNGKTFDGPLTVSGIGGTYQLADAWTMGSTRTLTLTSGTLDLNNQTLTTGLFNSNNSNVRVLAFGASTGKMDLTGTGANFVTTTTTGMTVTGTSLVRQTNSGSTAISMNVGTLNEANAISFSVIAGTYSLSIFSNSGGYKNIDFSGFAGTVAASAATAPLIYGDLTLSSAAGFSWTVGNPLNFASTSATARKITSNGKAIGCIVNFTGVGGTWQLQDAMLAGGTNTTNLTNGTLDLNGKTLTGASFTILAGTKTILFNGGTLLLTGSGANIFNNANPTGFTTTQGSSIGVIAMNNTAAKQFTGGASTYNCILSNDGAGAINTLGNNTITTIRNTVTPSAFNFGVGSTTTVTNFLVSGTSGNLVTLNAANAGISTLVKAGGGVVSCDYLSIIFSTATPGTTWYAGTHSTNGGNNSGWIFSAAPVTANGNFLLLF
jgi:hypothetical protein